MSQSTSPTTPKTDDNHSRFAQGERREGKWFWLSILLHAVGIVLLILFTPVGDVLLATNEPPKPADLTLSEQRAQEIAQQIRALSADDLQQRVMDLQQIDQQMEQLRVEQRDKLSDEQIQADQDAPQKALQQMQEVVQQMDKTKEVLDNKYTNDAVNESLQQVSDKQDKTNEILMSADMRYDEVRRAQKQAIVEQLEVQGWQQKVQQTENRDESLDKQIERTTNEVAHSDDSVKSTQKRLDETNQRLEDEKNKREDAKNDQKKAEQELSKLPKKDLSKDEQAKKKSLDRQKGSAKATVDRIDKAIARDEKSAERLSKQLKGVQKQLKERQDKLDNLKQQKKQNQQEHDKALEQRSKQQDEAKKSQQQAMTALKKAIDNADNPEGEITPQVTQTTTVTPPVTTDPVKLYDQARELESKIADSYREVRAVELAKVQNITLPEAMARVDVPEPVREPVDKQVLQSDVKTGKKLDEYKKELTKVDQQMQSMTMTSQTMLSSAQQVANGFANQIAEAITIQRRQKFEEMALENTGERAVDMTAMMNPGGEEEGESKSQSQGKEQPGDKAGQGNGAGAGRWGPGGGLPDLPKNVNNALPGRSVGAGGLKSDWMYLDTWWMLGPFPNPGRKNIHQAFPPETVINLDATYNGDGGRPIRWQFVQSKHAFISPPGRGPYEYTIWYAYTEVRFDQPTDMWIAVGSDDRSDIWINGQKVWASSDQLKGWNPGEGYRKVHFEQGVNRILYRIENGWHGMGFSMLLHTAPNSDQPSPIQVGGPTK